MPIYQDTIKYLAIRALLLNFLVLKSFGRILLHTISAAEKEDQAGKDYLKTAMEIDIAPTIELLLNVTRYPEMLPVSRALLFQYSNQMLKDAKKLHKLIEKPKRSKSA